MTTKYTETPTIEYETISQVELAKSKTFFGSESEDEICLGDVIVRRHTFKPTAEGEPLISITKGGLTSYCDAIEVVELGRGRFRFDFWIQANTPFGAIPVHTGNIYVRASKE